MNNLWGILNDLEITRCYLCTYEENCSNYERSTEFKNKLLELINDYGMRNDIARIDSDRFIEELSRLFRREGQFQKLVYTRKNDNFLLHSLAWTNKREGHMIVIHMLY